MGTHTSLMISYVLCKSKTPLEFIFWLAGFKHTQTCSLMNTSLVPMSFHLRVPGDGHTPSICATSDLDPETPRTASTPRHGLSGSLAKEFEILPSTGTIPPQSEMKVAVTLTSNQMRKYENVMVVDVDHVGEEILSLPITARWDDELCDCCWHHCYCLHFFTITVVKLVILSIFFLHYPYCKISHSQHSLSSSHFCHCSIISCSSPSLGLCGHIN